MLQPDRPLDAARYYLILPDAIGLGGSSKPSDGLHDRFPRYGYKDMVAAEERLVTEGLGIKHLRLVFGISMGAMHAWLWGEQYPALMDAIIPVACQPDKIAGRNLLWRRIITTAVRSDPEWEGGDYRQQPSSLARVYPIFKLMTSNAAQLQKDLSSIERQRRCSKTSRSCAGAAKSTPMTLCIASKQVPTTTQLRISKKSKPQFSPSTLRTTN